jgi:hypothetical protein
VLAHFSWLCYVSILRQGLLFFMWRKDSVALVTNVQASVKIPFCTHYLFLFTFVFFGKSCLELRRRQSTSQPATACLPSWKRSSQFRIVGASSLLLICLFGHLDWYTLGWKLGSFFVFVFSLSLCLLLSLPLCLFSFPLFPSTCLSFHFHHIFGVSLFFFWRAFHVEIMLLRCIQLGVTVLRGSNGSVFFVIHVAAWAAVGHATSGGVSFYGLSFPFSFCLPFFSFSFSF